MELTDHVRVIGRNWWRILILSFVAAALIYAWRSHRPETFESSVLVNVTPGGSTTNDSEETRSVFLARTYAELADTIPVLQRAVGTSLPLTASEAQAKVHANASQDVGFLTITASGDTPRLAQRLATAVSDALVATVAEQQARTLDQDLQSVNAEITSIASQLDALPANAPTRTALQARYEALLQSQTARRAEPQNRIEVVAPARVPSGPVSPKPTRDAVLGFVVAVIVVSESFVLYRALSQRFSSFNLQEVSRVTGLPVLAAIPRGGALEVLEGIRSLRGNLYLLPESEIPYSTAIVSASQGAGKSFTSAHLAASLAAQGSRVMLIDADLRRPVLHKRFGVARQPGLTDALDGVEITDTLCSVPVGTLHAAGEDRSFTLMPSGRAVPDPMALFGTEAFARVLDKRPFYERFTIIDTPPIDLFGDAIAIAAQCDSAVLVVDLKTSRRAAVVESVERLRRSGTTLLGLVINRAPAPRSRRLYRYRPSGSHDVPKMSGP
jgi:non-specific protein-tyrosine kinase